MTDPQNLSRELNSNAEAFIDWVVSCLEEQHQLKKLSSKFCVDVLSSGELYQPNLSWLVDYNSENHALESEQQFFDEVGKRLAIDYNEGRLTYEFCDDVVNDLNGEVIDGISRDPQSIWPELFDSVYSAFDAGEFHREKDKSDDPIADWTDPLIAEIVSTLPTKNYR